MIKKTQKYQQWLQAHKCHLNHDGSAGAMGPQGAVKIFSKSEEERGLRYLEYLGDGDSSLFLKVLESKPYGQDLVKKSECILHRAYTKAVGNKATEIGQLLQKQKTLRSKTNKWQK